MSDQCVYCTVRGDMALCRMAQCSKHDDWIVIELKRELNAEKAKCNAMRSLYERMYKALHQIASGLNCDNQ